MHSPVGIALAVFLPWILVALGSGCQGEGDGTGAAKAAAARETPNLVILVSDDQGTALGCYGTPGVQTPRLDALAARGVRFTRAYGPSAVCTPSRTSIYTGLMPHHHGATGFEPVSPAVKVWGEYLGDAGYRTGLIGKLGAKPIGRFPFDFMERSDKGDEGARDLDWHVAQLDAFLEAGDGRPWVLIVNFRDSHWPFPTDGAPFGPGSPAPHDPGDVVVPPTLVDHPAVREELARYYDGLRRMDATVGAMVERLAAESSRPLVGMFTSDNGPPFPYAKTTLYEAGVHMPLIVWGDGIARGERRDGMVSLIDLLPTLLDFGGLDEEGRLGLSLDGRSLRSLLAPDVPEESPFREAIFTTHDTHRVPPDIPVRAVRFGSFKYIRTYGEGLRFKNLLMQSSAAWPAMVAAAKGGDARVAALVTRFVNRPAEELFDLADDPFELENLAGAEAYAGELQRGRGLLESTDLIHLPEK